MLPNEVLLEIFDFYADEDFDGLFDEDYDEQRIQEWITLAHVCQRWRSVVFQAPRRLNLRLVCTPRTRVRDTLDIWPPFPLVIRDFGETFYEELSCLDNILAALEHNDRVCQIDLHGFTSSQIEYFMDSAAIHKTFPELTDIRLEILNDGLRRILPDSFLGGNASRLRSIILRGVPFPALPKLLLTVTHLVLLDLDISPSAYIPPEAMATSLSALTSLESLRLNFRNPGPRPASGNQRPSPPPLTRTLFRGLTKIRFKGASEYLEKILTWIDVLRLDELDITFFNQLIFDTPQLFQFISRSPMLRAPEKGYVGFRSDAIIVKFLPKTPDYNVVSVRILCTASEWQLSSLKQVCTSSLPLFSTLEDLYVFENQRDQPRWQDDVESTLWLELLRPFAAVKNLYLSDVFVPHIAPALQELVGERTTEVFPILENIFLETY